MGKGPFSVPEEWLDYDDPKAEAAVQIIETLGAALEGEGLVDPPEDFVGVAEALRESAQIAKAGEPQYKE